MAAAPPPEPEPALKGAALVGCFIRLVKADVTGRVVEYNPFDRHHTISMGGRERRENLNRVVWELVERGYLDPPEPTARGREMTQRYGQEQASIRVGDRYQATDLPEPTGGKRARQDQLIYRGTATADATPEPAELALLTAGDARRPPSAGSNLSAYELEHLQNVQRNREALAALGIEPLVEPEKREVKRHGPRKPSAPVVERRSPRVQGAPPKTYNDDEVYRELMNAGRKKRTRPKATDKVAAAVELAALVLSVTAEQAALEGEEAAIDPAACEAAERPEVIAAAVEELVPVVERTEAQRLRLGKRLAREMAPTADGVAFDTELPAAAPALGDDICISCMDEAHEFEPGCFGRLGCGHAVCKHCLGKWIAKGGQPVRPYRDEDMNMQMLAPPAKCPICRWRIHSAYRSWVATV